MPVFEYIFNIQAKSPKQLEAENAIIRAQNTKMAKNTNNPGKLIAKYQAQRLKQVKDAKFRRVFIIPVILTVGVLLALFHPSNIKKTKKRWSDWWNKPAKSSKSSSPFDELKHMKSNEIEGFMQQLWTFEKIN